MNNTRKILTVLAFSFLLVPKTLATTLQEAKAEGIVGEQINGFVGLVVTSASAEILALIQGVNTQREQRYQEIANQNGITIEQVAAVAYERAVEATESGHYIQNASGEWIQK
ncbi:MAG: hypothetical protein CMQ41_00345 [Gammaproteobacteria bacterium]|nr:hypothetical protein [Gammaproteobacteria bacterium]|tara:strand:+ start:2003 stop:2338 length:336 start_codon:yes stop_codon:yes gene_type:complete